MNSISIHTIFLSILSKHMTTLEETSFSLFRQGDGLSCDLFNICLEIIIRAANIDTTDSIYNKALQILGYADDLDIITRDIRSLDTTVENIVGAEFIYLGTQITTKSLE